MNVPLPLDYPADICPVTTLTTVPGVLQYRGAKIQVRSRYFLCSFSNSQILDLPGIIEGAKDGKVLFNVGSKLIARVEVVK
jgi:ribosome-interacting GTPase 1